MEKSLYLVLPLLGVVLIGYLAVRFDWLGQKVTESLGRFAVVIAIPSLVFHTLATSTLPKNTLNILELLACYYLGAILVFTLAILVARFVFRSSASDQSTYGIYATGSNVILLGLPAVILVLGAKWTTLMILVGTHGLVMALIATTIDGLARRRFDGLPQDLLRDVKREGRQPIFIALIAGLILNLLGLTLPVPANTMFGLLASAAVPCALLTIGGILGQISFASINRPTAAVCAFKLVAFPLVVWIIGTFVVSIPSSWTWIAVMLAIMPIAFEARGPDGSGTTTIALSNMLGGICLLALTYLIVIVS